MKNINTCQSMWSLRDYLTLPGPAPRPPGAERAQTLTFLIGFIHSLQCFADVCFKHITFRTKTSIYFTGLCWFRSQQSSVTRDPKTFLGLQERANLAPRLHSLWTLCRSNIHKVMLQPKNV